MRADADLPWYFGSGASTWAGDAGLRSPMGGQLEAARQVKRVDVEWPPWMTKGQQPHAVDVSAAEDRMLESTAAAFRARRIALRLACLSRIQYLALTLHYDETCSLPFGIDASAVLLASARRLVLGPQIREHYHEARGALRRARGVGGNVTRVHAELGCFLREREQARALRRSKAAVDHEVLRRALHDATEAQRQALESQAAALVQRSKETYDAVQLEDDDDKPVQVNDPRRGRTA